MWTFHPDVDSLELFPVSLPPTGGPSPRAVWLKSALLLAALALAGGVLIRFQQRRRA